MPTVVSGHDNHVRNVFPVTRLREMKVLPPSPPCTRCNYLKMNENCEFPLWNNWKSHDLFTFSHHRFLEPRFSSWCRMCGILIQSYLSINERGRLGVGGVGAMTVKQWLECITLAVVHIYAWSSEVENLLVCALILSILEYTQSSIS